MTGPDDIDTLAAEYVLGTLDATERSDVARRRSSDIRLEAAIEQWQRRLAPLDQTTPEVAPPPDLFARITARLGEKPNAGTNPVLPLQSAEIIQLRRQFRRWRLAAISATALAAGLVVAIGLRETVFTQRPQNFVAVFQKDDSQPAFLLTIDLASRELTIRPVTAERQPGKSYQLWIVSDQIGPAPRSLGLLDTIDQPTRKSMAGYAPALLQRATFGISLEQAGGSQTGRPSPQALHGRLYPTQP